MPSDMVIVAMVAAVPATIGAISGLINGRRLTVVHDAVNGGLATAKAEILTLKEEVARLNKLLT